MDINGCCDKASKILRYPKEKLGCLRLPDGQECFRNTCSILSHSKIQEIAQHPHGQAQVKGIGCRVSPVSPLILASHPIWNRELPTPTLSIEPRDFCLLCLNSSRRCWFSAMRSVTPWYQEKQDLGWSDTLIATSFKSRHFVSTHIT